MTARRSRPTKPPPANVRTKKRRTPKAPRAKARTAKARTAKVRKPQKPAVPVTPDVDRASVPPQDAPSFEEMFNKARRLRLIKQVHRRQLQQTALCTPALDSALEEEDSDIDEAVDDVLHGA